MAQASTDTVSTAEIIRFPVRTVAPPAPPAANEQVSRAMARLESALADQRAALAKWRESMDQLRKTTAGLGLSLQRYQRSLGKLSDDVGRLKGQAQQLEQWADGVISRQKQGAITPGGTPAGGESRGDPG